MANKIDKINVGGADYEINLPTTATPSITSLTVTGNLTCSGTANLSVINFTHSILGNAGTISSDSRATLIFSVPRTLRMQAGGVIISTNVFTLSTVSFTDSTTGTMGVISAAPGGFLFSGSALMKIDTPILSIVASQLTLSASSSLRLKRGSYTYSLPDKSGTIALTSDMPNLTGYTSCVTWVTPTGGSFNNVPCIEITKNNEIRYHTTSFIVNTMNTAAILCIGDHCHSI